jgi:hypothetical protein
MNRPSFTLCILGTVVAATACGDVQTNVQAYVRESGCRTGGSALANAYVLANPIYALYFGSLDAYVANNAEHFRADGDAIRCAAALSQAFLRSALQLYDPADQQRRAELNAELESMGISRGQQESSPSGDVFGVSMQLSRLARVLPAVANGDYEALRRPTNELEQMQMAGEQILIMFLRTPEMAAILAPMEPKIRELANLEYRAMQQAAVSLANAQ